MTESRGVPLILGGLLADQAMDGWKAKENKQQKAANAGSLPEADMSRDI
jgi:hypothetical protein